RSIIYVEIQTKHDKNKAACNARHEAVNVRRELLPLSTHPANDPKYAEARDALVNQEGPGRLKAWQDAHDKKKRQRLYYAHKVRTNEDFLLYCRHARDLFLKGDPTGGASCEADADRNREAFEFWEFLYQYRGAEMPEDALPFWAPMSASASSADPDSWRSLFATYEQLSEAKEPEWVV